MWERSEGFDAGFLSKTPESKKTNFVPEARRIVSVTINQIRNLTTSNHGLVLHRQKVPMLQTIGLVESVNEQTTKISYLISDFTGSKIEVINWRSADTDDQKSSKNETPIIMENTYCVVYGQSRKKSADECFIVAFKILPLKDPNHITIHLLETIYHFKDLEKNKNLALLNNQCDTNKEEDKNSFLSNRIKSTVQGLSNSQSMVLSIIKNSNNMNGISRDEIYQALRTLSKNEIDQILEFFINEGHIYSTFDENHFNILDM